LICEAPHDPTNHPITEEQARQLKVGDEVLLNGRIVLSRDIGHKFMKEQKPEWLKPILENMVIYHCGPVVRKNADGTWSFVAAGPTTSIREEPYQADVIETYKVRVSSARWHGQEDQRGSAEDRRGLFSTPPEVRAACWPSA